MDSLDEFWSAVATYFDVRIQGGDGTVLGDRSMPGAQWFPGARVSYAEHVFRGKGAQGAPGHRRLPLWRQGFRPEAASRESLANPEALDFFVGLAEGSAKDDA